MFLCIDIGATKTLLTLFSESGHRLRYLKFPTPPRPKSFTSDLGIYLDELLHIPSRFSVEKVVVAVPASFKNKKPFKYGNLPWNEFPLTTAISVCIKNLFNHPLPIYYLNDAAAATIYESAQLPDNSGTAIYLTLSTGIGGGITRDGRLSPDSASFEPGHRKYSYDGKRQEWEDLASASAIRQLYHKRDVRHLHKPEQMTEIATRLSLGLTSIIRKYHPNYIILGGALSFPLPHYRVELENLLSKNLKTDNLPLITRATRPLESTIYGCYLYGKEQD